MDPSYFGLEGHPFEQRDNANDPYISEVYESLTTELNAGLKAPHGITLLIGEEGAGKTTFIRSFSAGLSDAFTVAYLPSTGPGLRHLLTEVIEQLGGSVSPGGNEQALLEELTSLARARAAHGRSTLVILDDAHDLPAKTIERLGKMFGDDPAEPSLLHVTLVGRPELLDRMNATNDRSILKHLVQVCRMDAIGPEESFQYIADRVQKAGGEVDDLFTEDALRLIVQRANGLPAQIDSICSAALERAEDNGQTAVGAESVGTATDFDEYDDDHQDPASDPDGTTYFFTAEEEGDLDVATTTTTARDLDRATDSDDGRKKLAMWALAAIAVMALLAATMSQGPDDSIPAASTRDLAAVDSTIANRGGDAAPVAPPVKKVVPKPVVAAPAAAPPLVVNRDDPKASNSATPRVQSPTFDAKAKTTNGAEAGKTRVIAAVRDAGTKTTTGAKKVATKVGQETQAAAKKVTSTVTKTSNAVTSGAKTATAAVTGQATTKPKATTTAPKTVVAKAEPPKATVTTATSSVITHPAGRPYSVQVGAFTARPNAEKVLAQLNNHYDDGRIVPSTVNGKKVYRVVSGAFSNTGAAKDRSRVLIASGFKTFVRKF